jgi:subtilisin-like proprotein convertase family protein
LGNGDTTGPYAGLVGTWRGNTITGGSGLEEINGYTAYMNGSAAFVSTGTAPQGYMAFNTGIVCSGAVDSTCITVPHSPILNPTTAITLECWVFAALSTVPQIIFSKGDYYSGYPYRLLETTEYQSFNLFAVSLNTVNLLGVPTYGGHIPTNKWTHLAFTYNSVTGDYIYYMNGEVTKTGNQSIGPLLNLTTDLTIGGGPNTFSFDGMIDEVRISDYVKTQEEIIKGMFTSIDANNDPNPSGHTAVFSFEGTLNSSDGAANRGYFSGIVNGIRFTQVYDNFGQTPSPLDRWDAGNFANGYRIHYVGLNFGGLINSRTDSIYMPEGLTISDINVFAAVHNNNPADISISLKNPEGSSTVVLYPGAGTNPGLHLFTIFDDQADSTIGGIALAPWSPRVKPENSLSAFNTQNSLGWWKFNVTDIRPAPSGGNFEGWGIQFNNQTLIGIVSQTESNIPEKFALHQNYPNPFNPVTAIKYDIAKSTNVKITVYDILGREVMVPANEFKKAGYYSLQIDASFLASGVYFYKIEAGNFTNTLKMMLVK